nr:hypothetical protein [uncultured Desulfobacter sp.]
MKTGNIKKRLTIYLQLALMLFFLQVSGVVTYAAEGHENAAKEESGNAAKTYDKETQLQVLQCLNMIAVSLTHIMTYNDKVILDQEYNMIINNLNLSNIPDADLISLLQELMDLLTSSKINDYDREYLLKNYDRNVQNELKTEVKSLVFDTDIVTNPYTTVLAAFVATGSFYFNYRSQMNAYVKEKEEGAWAIESKTMTELNNFYKKLLKHSWTLMRKYNLPDTWRLDEKQLRDYTNILKEPDLIKRFRKLERIETSFQMFPPYWYYRGQSAQETGNTKEALRCFLHFQQIHQSILRKDPYAASVAMCKTMLTKDSKSDDVKSDLALIVSNSEDNDWGNLLFAALQYGRIGDSDPAGKLILRNLDNGHTAFIDTPDMVRTVGPALLLSAKKEVFNRILDEILHNDKVKNYDVLWLYGQTRNSDILKKIHPEFDKVLLQTAEKSFFNPLNLFKDNKLLLFLPTRWVTGTSLVTLKFQDGSDEKKVNPSNTEILDNFPDMTLLTFNDVFSVKKFIKKKQSADISISFIHEKLDRDKRDIKDYNIEMVFQLDIVSAKERSEKELKHLNVLFEGRIPESVKVKKKGGDRLTIWCSKKKIILNGDAFDWNDDGLIINQ